MNQKSIQDKLGKDPVILSFFILIVIGHGLFIGGCMLSYYPLMIIGRFLFGAGCESYAMAISPLICDYFRGKELSFALGLTLALSRIGSSINDVSTYYFYEQTGSIIFAISVGFVLVLVCLALILILLCYRMRHIKQRNNVETDEVNPTEPENTNEFDQSITADYYSMDGQAIHQSIQSTQSIPALNDSLNSRETLPPMARRNPLLDTSPALRGCDYR